MERKLRFGFLALLLAACPTVGHAATLVEKGQPKAVIVLPEKASPSVAQAAKVLQAHVKQMSGAELPMRTEDKVGDAPAKDEAWVLVGEGKLTAKLGLTSKGLGPGGVHLSAKGSVVALFGADAKTPSDPDGTR